MRKYARHLSGHAQLLTSAVSLVLANSTSNSSWLKGIWSMVSVCVARNQTQAEAIVQGASSWSKHGSGC